MPHRPDTLRIAPARNAQRLYFHVVQGTVVAVLALQLLLQVTRGMEIHLNPVLLTLYGALIVLSWYGASGAGVDVEKPWGLLFGFLTLLVVLLCAETGGLASPYVLLLLTTCVFAALSLPARSALLLTTAASLAYGTTAWLYHDAEVGLLSGGAEGLRHAVLHLPRLDADALSALLVHLAYFWLGSVVALRVSTGFRERVDRAESVAILDPLTALPNRRGFIQKLRLEAQRIDQWDWSIAMLVIDLDHFKRVNDEFDHKVGDTALVHAARILREVAGPLDHVARLGGEEFVVAAVGSDRRHAVDLATRINRSFRRHDWREVAPGLAGVTCSIGVAVRNPSEMPDRCLDYEAMLQDADHALLVRKRHGRDGYFVAGDRLPIDRPEAPPVLKRPPPDGPVKRARFIRP